MKNLFFLLSFLSSCAPSFVPIKGNYPAPPFEGISENNREVVWDKIIDLFAQKGLPIKLLDKNSGLIVSSETELIWSYEDKDGKLYGDRAHVVVRKRMLGGKPVGEAKITGEWNIRIKSEGNGTKININLVNIRSYTADLASTNGSRLLTPGSEAKSTGKFEQIIFEMIK